jgi:uncharacterized glyoxalase superfamily protein PhnB
MLLEARVDTLGFEVKMLVDGDGERDVAHAELTLGPNGMVMLGSEPTGGDDRWGAHAGAGWIYVAVEDPDGLLERVRGAGAEVAMELTDTDYGSRDFAVRDPEGNLWNFGTYRP